MNKKIKEAFSNICPTPEQKDKMLKKVFEKKKKKLPIFRFCTVGVSLGMLFFLFQVQSEKPTPRTLEPIHISTPFTFKWKEECYIVTTTDSIEIGKVLGVTKINDYEVEVYAHQTLPSIIYLNQDGNYIPYKKTVCQ